MQNSSLNVQPENQRPAISARHNTMVAVATICALAVALVATLGFARSVGRRTNRTGFPVAGSARGG